MLRFSDRIGATQPPTVLQLDEMNEDLRASLWNALANVLGDAHSRLWPRVAQLTAVDIVKTPMTDVPPDPLRSRRWLKERFFELEWYDVYNLLEMIVDKPQTISNYPRGLVQNFIGSANVILEREGSGYRFIDGHLAPITNEVEMMSIEEALAGADKVGLIGVRTHLSEAVKLLSLKPEPDFRNSIKESISAVEAAVNKIAGTKPGGVSAALRVLEAKGISLHGALKDAVVKLYGYTSDKDGIRHAIMDAPDVDFDDAKFMLVSCSAFAHFLICKAEAAGCLPK